MDIHQKLQVNLRFSFSTMETQTIPIARRSGRTVCQRQRRDLEEARTIPQKCAVCCQQVTCYAQLTSSQEGKNPNAQFYTFHLTSAE